ncbi:MAG: hypothetical protein QOH16_696 [Gaiellaceae bacterium]|nr:hypothetical protein [Gaiellaceae bacterium]
MGVNDLIRIAARVNPRRRFLFVSTVLAKHLPVEPERALAAGRVLAMLNLKADGHSIDVADAALAEAIRHPAGARNLLREPPFHAPQVEDVVVIGLAETATALGHSVADAYANATYIHTTREDVGPGSISFLEEHSHAQEHRLYLSAADLPPNTQTAIVVDDELSTGTTLLNLIVALHNRRPFERYCFLSLLETLSEASRGRIAAVANELGVDITVRALLSAPALRENIDTVLPQTSRLAEVAAGCRSSPSVLSFESSVPVSARGLISAQERLALRHQAEIVASSVVRNPARPAYVLGTGEFMYFPMLFAQHLPGEVFVSSTTRTPIAVPGGNDYPIKRACAWKHPDGALRFAYNLPPATDSDVYVIVESPWGMRDLDRLLCAMASSGLASPTVVVVGTSSSSSE